MRNWFTEMDDNPAGTMVIFGLLALALAYFGASEFFADQPGWVLNSLGVGFLPCLVFILSLGHALAFQRRSGSSAGLAMASGALTVAGVLARDSSMVHLALTAAVIGSLYLLRTLSRAGSRASSSAGRRQAEWNFRMFIIWVAISGMTLNPHASLRAAVLLVGLHFLGPDIERLSTWLSDTFRKLTTPIDQRPQPDASPVPPPPVEPIVDRWLEQKNRIAEFISNRFRDQQWPEARFVGEQVVETGSFVTFVLEKPDTIDPGSFEKLSDSLAAALKLPVEAHPMSISLDTGRQAYLIQIARSDSAEPSPKIGYMTPSFYDDVIAMAESIRPARSSWEIVVGVDAFNQPLRTRFDDDTAHALVAGTNGSGKSVFLNAALAQLMLANGPDKLRLVFADAGRSTQAFFTDVPHLWRPITNDLAEQVQWIRELVAERERRSHLWSEVKATNIDAYWAKCPEADMPRIFLIVDEATTLQTHPDLSDDFNAAMVELGNNGRKYGIHIIYGLQRALSGNAGGMPTALRDQLGHRFIFQLENPDHYDRLAEVSSSPKLRKKGDGLYKIGPVVRRFQSMYLPDKEHEHQKFPDQAWIESILDEVYARYGRNDFAAKVENRNAAVAAVRAAHDPKIGDREWLIMTGVASVYAAVEDAYKRISYTAEQLLPFVERAIPDGYELRPAFTAREINDVLRAFFDAPARDGSWPLSRKVVDQLVEGHRAKAGPDGVTAAADPAAGFEPAKPVARPRPNIDAIADKPAKE